VSHTHGAIHSNGLSVYWQEEDEEGDAGGLSAPQAIVGSQGLPLIGIQGRLGGLDTEDAFTFSVVGEEEPFFSFTRYFDSSPAVPSATLYKRNETTHVWDPLAVDPIFADSDTYEYKLGVGLYLLLVSTEESNKISYSIVVPDGENSTHIVPAQESSSVPVPSSLALWTGVYAVAALIRRQRRRV